MRALARVLGKVFLGHAPHRFAKLFLLGGETEIHGIPPEHAGAIRTGRTEKSH
jgi:hypothetical protein